MGAPQAPLLLVHWWQSQPGIIMLPLAHWLKSQASLPAA